MSMQFPTEQFAQAKAVQMPHRGEYGRTFDLHPALFALTFGAYIAYIAIMAAAFADADMAIPVAIFVIFVVAGFGTPALWAKVAAPAPGKPPVWATFIREGFECLTGHVSAEGAMVQVLIMPAMLLFWGTAVAIIAACVR
ncbi:MAG: hypothetical protein J7498_03275 [Sphingobium sp.]|nr:hypothetical protein [Sphingobium sp.]